MRLAIDIGTSNLKLGVFDLADQLVYRTQMPSDVMEAAIIAATIAEYQISAAILSSVLPQARTQHLLEGLVSCKHFVLGADTNINFINKYQTPQTCGSDRIAAVAGARARFAAQAVLIITGGTCLVVDYMDQFGVYHGGSIAPGVQMRFKSLADYTASLPLLNFDSCYRNLVGHSTKECILAGIRTGLTGELALLLTEYRRHYPDLKTILLSGGDADLLEALLSPTGSAVHIKKVPNLTLEGLNAILKLNLDED